MNGLRSTRSKVDSRVTLLSLDQPSTTASTPSIVSSADTSITINMESIKAEPITPSKLPLRSSQVDPPTSATSSFTSLRRTTRSSISTPANVRSEGSSPSKLNLASYAYHDPNPVTPRKRVKRETEDIGTPLRTVSGDGDVKPPITPGSAKKKALPQLALEKPHPEPSRWRKQYAMIEHMRKGIIAPVDDMGCERPQTMADANPKTMRFHVLISLMLSSQTKDAITSAAVTSLHTTLPGGLTAQSLADAAREVVEGCINKVGFWRRKAEYIQEAALRLLEREGDAKGDVPDTLEGLCDLRGVGPKMAFLALQCAWDINAGIGVDVHVHRITNRLKWHKPPTKSPEETRLNLQSWLPSNLHKGINPLLVGFGQVICLPVGPRCDICLMGTLCPSRVKVDPKGRKEVIYTFKNDFEDLIVPMGEGHAAADGGGIVPSGVSDGPAVQGLDGQVADDPLVKVEVSVEDGPLAKVEVGYENGPLVKLEPGVAEGVTET